MNKRLLMVGGSLALLGSALFVGTAAAQEAMAPHPAHIHSGSCPAPGGVVQALSNVSGQFLHDDTAMVSAPMGPVPAMTVEGSVTTVPMAYHDLFGGAHSIVVHKSAEEMGVYLVCGDIGGPEMGATDIAIGLGAVGESGYTGIATLHDNGDDTTTVSVYVTTHAMMAATPDASPGMMMDHPSMSPTP